MKAKPEKQAKSEKELRDEEAESEMLIKLREEAEAQFDALVFGGPTKSESEKQAEEAERKVLLKFRQDENARIRSAYKSNSAKAAPLEKSESALVRGPELGALLYGDQTKSESEQRDEEAERKLRLKLRQEAAAEWDELMSADDLMPAFESISETAAPRQQKRPRCFA